VTGAATTGDPRSGIYLAVSAESREIRCAACGRLIAKLVGDQLAIKRADLQATFRGCFQAALVCSDPRCRHTNFIDIQSHQREGNRFF
jgi:phage FluMu protein Com